MREAVHAGLRVHRHDIRQGKCKCMTTGYKVTACMHLGCGGVPPNTRPCVLRSCQCMRRSEVRSAASSWLSGPAAAAAASVAAPPVSLPRDACRWACLCTPCRCFSSSACVPGISAGTWIDFWLSISRPT